MAKPHRHDEVTGDLELTWTTPAHLPERQAEFMVELRNLSNQIPTAYRARDELLHALAASESLSRRDMAAATGLNKSRVDQIILEMATADRERKNAAAASRTRRHIPA